MNSQVPGLSIAAIVRRYYAVSLVHALASGFLAGVYPIFLRSRGLDQFEINSVLAVYFAVTFFTDVPTGAFADRLGRSRSLALGCLLRALAFVLYFGSDDYVEFLVAETIDAIGTTFCTGAIDAWGVDALDAAGFSGTKDRLFSRLSQLSGLGFMTTAVAGAYIGAVDLAWPWLFGAGGFLVTALVGVSLPEAPRRTARLDLQGIGRAIAVQIRVGIQRGLRVRPVLMLAMAEAVVLAAWAPYWLAWPVLFTETHAAGVWTVGWIFCLLSGARLLGAEVVARSADVARFRVELVSGLVIVAGALLAGAGVMAARADHALGLLCLMNVALGAREPLATAWFNEQLRPADRATMLSFRSTLSTAGAAGGLLLGGYVAARRGIGLQWQLAGALALLAVPCYLALRRRPSMAREATPAL